MAHQYNLSWFRTEFRPQFEILVVKPAQHMVQNSETKMPAFVWIACAIDWLAGFWWGKSTKNANKDSYTGFINAFFPVNTYDPDNLYDSLRNGLIHMYTIKNVKYLLTDGNPSLHLEMRYGQQILNLENFFADFMVAKEKFFEKVEQDPKLLENVIERYRRDGFLGIYPLHPLD